MSNSKSADDKSEAVHCVKVTGFNLKYTEDAAANELMKWLSISKNEAEDALEALKSANHIYVNDLDGKSAASAQKQLEETGLSAFVIHP